MCSNTARINLYSLKKLVWCPQLYLYETVIIKLYWIWIYYSMWTQCEKIKLNFQLLFNHPPIPYYTWNIRCLLISHFDCLGPSGQWEKTLIVSFNTDFFEQLITGKTLFTTFFYYFSHNFSDYFVINF